MPKSVFSDAYTSVIDYLVELRKAQGVSQVELARRLGKTQQFVSLVERRERRLDVVEFLVYVRALRADPATSLAEVARLLPHDATI